MKSVRKPHTTILRLAGVALALVAASLVSPVPEHRANAETVQSCRRRGCKLNINTYRCTCPRKRPRLTASQRCRRRGCVYQRHRRRCVCRKRPVVRRVTPRLAVARPAGRRNRRTGIRWVTIPGGSYLMGSAKRVYYRPVRRVTIPTFELSRSEITVAQYQRCVRARVCPKPERGRYSSYYMTRNAHMAVNYVTWQNARTYAKWATARLPSEAEWEYAARSRGKDWKYPWGNERPSCKRVAMSQKGCRMKHPQTVCQASAGHTQQGLCDMAGNVWEWIEDVYHRTYAGAPSDGSAWLTPNKGYRMIRGGGWAFMPSNLETRYRTSKRTSTRQNYIGFRVARDKP